ncbi:unnamed protein product [Nezara viridula]|uniref:Uncharacterized protein n=1 Tax=Nezara viridula TaxID=85310 RepID=A0A9P0H960_NEZVI|nr:unnamed protein product [Nezara viridula]
MFQSQQFDLLLYQLMISDEDFGLLDNPKLKLHIAMKNNVSITACEFFTLDFSLVLAMAASVTTYLVIFVQFGHPLAPRN